ncbi:MAG: TIGR03085 family metal-binding protein [Acidimicrobiales bacterium]
MASYARTERQALCDLLDQVGADAPTLCEGWTSADLAAHLVIRDNRPDALPGIMLPQLAAYTSRVQHKVARRSFNDVVSTIRHGPPKWSPVRLKPVDSLVNTVEYFIHHEDVRRAQPDWQPRQLESELENILWSRFRQMQRLLFRKAGVTLRIESAGFAALGSSDGPHDVTLAGNPSELLIFATGRKKNALIEVHGPDEAIAALMNAPIGI